MVFYIARSFCFVCFLKLLFVNMTLRALFNISKLCGHRFALSPRRVAAARCVRCPMLFPRRWLTLSAVSLCDAESADTDSNEVTKTRTIRILPRNRIPRFKRRNLPPVVERRNDPSVSVLVDMLGSRDCDSDSRDPNNGSLNTARTEIDEKLKELEDMTSIQIRDIHLAMEMEDENMVEEVTEMTEV